jgi:hypothetical protein
MANIVVVDRMTGFSWLIERLFGRAVLDYAMLVCDMLSFFQDYYR